jgi:hypothetical protein
MKNIKFILKLYKFLSFFFFVVMQLELRVLYLEPLHQSVFVMTFLRDRVSELFVRLAV